MELQDSQVMIEKLDWELISELLRWDVQQRNEYDILYHYYSGQTLRKVLLKDSIKFRLASASTFQDKMEGKAVEVYYDLALSELRTEGLISEEQYNCLSAVTVPTTTFLSRKTNNGNIVFGNYEFEEFIICFSTEENDRYMFDHYIDDNEDGYCLHFSGIDLKELTYAGFNNQSKIELIPVIYGREVVDFIREKILGIALNPVRMKNYVEFVSSLLHYVQYAAKLSKYSRENEVRMVVYRYKSINDSLSDMERTKDGQYLYFPVEKTLLFKVSSDPNNSQKETDDVMRYIQECGYINT